MYFASGSPPDRRQRLLTVLAECVPALIASCPDDATSLIRSGLVDSLGLLQIAAFIEAETGRSLEGVDLDPEREWDTVADILVFIQRAERTAE